MAVYEKEPVMAPIHEAQGNLLITRTGEFAHGLVRRIYPGMPEDKVGLFIRYGTGIKFSGIKTDASWSLERQVSVNRRDARPSVHLGINLKRDNVGHAIGTAEIYVAAGGRMMDASDTEMEPVLIDGGSHILHGSEKALLQKLGETVLAVWDVLDDVAGNIPMVSNPDTQSEFARVIREKLTNKK